MLDLLELDLPFRNILHFSSETCVLPLSVTDISQHLRIKHTKFLNGNQTYKTEAYKGNYAHASESNSLTVRVSSVAQRCDIW